jgi:hypothetical protein
MRETHVESAREVGVFRDFESAENWLARLDEPDGEA